MEENKDFRESNDKCFNMYSPRLKIEKLLFLADLDVNRTASLNAACRLIKLGDDRVLLRTVISKYNLNDDDDEDKMWLQRADERYLGITVVFQSHLDQYLNYDKEMLEYRRKLLRRLGEVHYNFGELNEASTIFQKEILLCTMEKQISDSYMKLILVGLKRGDLKEVLEWVNKARVYHSVEVAGKVTCASALAHMGLGRYKTAATEFLDVDYELGVTFNEVILPRDVAIYGGLCALASYDRSEIQQVLDSNQAWRVLGLAPEIRKIVEEFHKGHYGDCLNYLQSIKANLLLDIYVCKHVEKLFDQIREKAFLEYAQPFTSLHMHTMATIFNLSVSEVEKELFALIRDNKLQARIDSHSKVLYRGRSEDQSQPFKRIGNENDSSNDVTTQPP